MKRRPHHPSFIPALALAAGLIANPAAAQEEIVYYDSNGFETPDYQPGTLPGYNFNQGQDLWVTIGDDWTDRDQIVVQDQVVREGNAAVAFHAAGHDANRPELYRGTFFSRDENLPIMQVDLDFRLASSGEHTEEWLIVHQQTAMSGLHMLGILANDDIRVMDFVTGEFFIADQSLVRDEWHHLTIRFNFPASTADYWLNGELIFDDVNTVETFMDMYSLFGIFADGAGDDTFYMDNLRIVNTTEDTGCTADWNDDGDVNTADFVAFLNDWANADSDADLNEDGEVNTQDFIAFLGLWSAGC